MIRPTTRHIMRYIGRIRNKGKQDYALAYYKYRTECKSEPDYHSFNISYMAAQAVRQQVNEDQS